MFNLLIKDCLVVFIGKAYDGLRRYWYYIYIMVLVAYHAHILRDCLRDEPKERLWEAMVFGRRLFCYHGIMLCLVRNVNLFTSD